jgi:predicted nuclease of predicted toxin-antitoxin system
MSLKLYVDEHVPFPITNELRRRGVDVIRVQDEGLDGTPDGVLLNHVTDLGRLLFTQDTDFLRETALRQRASESFAGVIFARQNIISTAACVDDLELICKAGNQKEFDNRVTHLPLR